MQMNLDCIACFVRQATEACRLIGTGPDDSERILKACLKGLSEFDLKSTPPLTGQYVHRLIREYSNSRDPYKNMKREMNQLAIREYRLLRERVQQADNPLQMACKIAVSGNILDSGVHEHLNEKMVHSNLQKAHTEEVDADFDELQKYAEKAEHILLLADNAGEFIWDMLLVEVLGPERVTIAVKGRPILNDFCIDDLQSLPELGFSLPEKARIVSNGSDAPGTILSDCSEEFLDVFCNSDLILSKGQGNFESLSDVKAPIFFLLMAKCSLVANVLQVALNSHLIKKTIMFQEIN